MAFDNVVLDPNVANGMKVTRQYHDSITVKGSGAEERMTKAGRSRKVFSWPYSRIGFTEYAALRDFYELRFGRVNSFLIWDPSDLYASAQSIGTGNGSQTVFQIQRVKTDTVRTVTWNLLHPVPTGTAIPVQHQGFSGTGAATTSNAVTVNGVAKVEGTDYTVNALTGQVTFTVAPAAAAAIAWTGWFYVTARFKEYLEMDFDSIQANMQVELIECLFE